MAKWGTLEHPGDNDVRPTQNRVQPTASDSSDQLFFIRKMGCEGYAFGVKLSSEPLRGGSRYAPCTPAQDRAPVAKKRVRTPILFHALNTGRCSNSICAVMCLPLAPYTQARNNIRQEKLDSGGGVVE